MVEFGKFVHTKTGKYVMSILLGFGLASLFRAACKGKNCLEFHAPPLDEIKNKIYKYVPNATKCSSNKKIINM